MSISTALSSSRARLRSISHLHHIKARVATEDGVVSRHRGEPALTQGQTALS